ncbi:protein ENDOSPERM DEFECTIVE 1-like [Populus nigra]|uniref:protein ENDOSPERM DEFECTIVE 1-like n=1 Tax=Populus nigra TaxID=3691 RepID=UPI002B26C24D|nr:protein ENDOSPERM DEFECTIVE 1-like [Populus nigra]
MMKQEQATLGPHPPNPPPRRPRVREVSSRFMSPIASPSSSLSPLPSNKQRSSFVQRQRRNQELDADCSPQRKQQQQQHQRAVVKLSKKNEPRSHTHNHRPDTPTLNPINTSSYSKLLLMHQRSTSNINISSAAAKLLKSTGISISTDSSSDHHNINNGVRSSLPDLLGDTDTSSCDPSLFHSLKSAKLPPVGPCSKIPIDASRKTKKVSSHQEDVQSLKLLHNHYLQWRFVNAKAQASTQAQTSETERNLYSLGVKIAELYNSVKRKRVELGLLQRIKLLWTIIEAQMPYLDEWSAFETDYSVSLSEAIQALLNASLQVPISGNARADIREVGEALNSAAKLMDTIAFHIESLMPKAEETEHLISEVARVTGGERGLIEECGDLLSMTCNSQVKECSLRGQLIQFYQSRHNQQQGEEQ